MSTTQFTVRIDERLAAWVDELVEAEHASGRAAIVSRALERERRRLTAERDARIYAEHGEAPGMAELAAHAAKLPLGVE